MRGLRFCVTAQHNLAYDTCRADLLRTLAGAGTQRAEGDLKEESGFECLIWLAASVAQDKSGAMHTIDDCLPSLADRITVGMLT